MNSKRKIVLLGKSGTGKSLLGNKIIGTSIFPVRENSLVSRTKVMQEAECSLKDGTLLHIIDTPQIDFNDCSSFSSLISQCKAFFEVFREGCDAIIYCIPATNERLEATEIQDLLFLKNLFQEKSMPLVYIALTHLNHFADPLEKQEIIDKWKEGLARLLESKNINFFTNDMLLFADFDDFSNKFISPFERMLVKSHLVRPDVGEIDPEEPLAALNNPLVLKCLAYANMRINEDFKIAKYGYLLNSQGDLALIEMKVVTLDVISSYVKKDLLEMLNQIRESDVPFFQDLYNYFTSEESDSYTPSLFNDTKDTLRKANEKLNEGKTTLSINNREKLIKEVAAVLGDNISSSLIKLLISKINNDIKEQEASIHDKLRRYSNFLYYLTSPSAESVAPDSNSDDVVKDVFNIFAVSSLILFFPSTPFAAGSLLIGFLNWWKRREKSEKNYQENELPHKLCREFIKDEALKKIFVSLLILYFDLTQL